MKINNDKNTIEFGGKEYPPTMHNAQVYQQWLRAKDETTKRALEKQLSEVMLEF
jgi:hypothetical protein